MQRVLVAICVLFAFGSLGGTLVLKYHVQLRSDRVEGLARQISEDLKAIRVLRAEWAYLSSPERVQRRAVRFLALMPPAAGQVLARIEDVPFRLPGAKAGHDRLPVAKPAGVPRRGSRRQIAERAM